jgi:hypothetical protein
MSQQTSVEYLIEQLQEPCRGIPSHVIEHAQKLHEKEVAEAWNDGNLIARISGVLMESYNDGIGYYKENFKK